jgi:hypothetical protein
VPGIGRRLSFTIAGALVLSAGLGGLAPANVSAASYSLQWVQQTPAPAPVARADASMTYDAIQQKAVLFGGMLTDGTPLGDTWQWDGAQWVQSSPAQSPSPREWTAMAFDAHRGVSVLFSGGNQSGVAPADTWEWNGVNWLQPSLAAAPAARAGATMVYDPVRGVVLLFGGNLGSSHLNDETWTYDGSAWTQLKPLHHPPARWLASMAYDSARDRTVLFGGFNDGQLGDTWEWDGNDWTQASSCGAPSARFAAAMVYDDLLQRTVLFGGKPYQDGTAGDTWEWDGINWTQVSPTPAPPPRMTAAMAYDSARGRAVLFGGDPGNLKYIGDTWEGTASASANNPPTVRLSSTAIDATEGVQASLTGTISDPDSTSWTATVNYGDGVCEQLQPAADGTIVLRHTYQNVGNFSLRLSVRDDGGQTGSASARVSVANSTPTVSSLSFAPQVVAVGGVVYGTAVFQDTATLDTHSVSWTWGDGTSGQSSSIWESGGSGTAYASHTYLHAGLYSISAVAGDEDGAAGSASYSAEVVFDPAAGSVSGSGTFTSPPGAYAANPSASGKASFSLDAAYKSGASKPSGSVIVSSQAIGFRLQSSSLDWLVVDGDKYEFRGSASVNGATGYAFSVSGVAFAGNAGSDTLRLRVWNAANGSLVYDNQPSGGPYDYGTQAISSGNVSIHS